eukprot:scaffold1484_cov241-Pinguiococcus_pyrenoidosus.AAC.18
MVIAGWNRNSGATSTKFCPSNVSRRGTVDGAVAGVAHTALASSSTDTGPLPVSATLVPPASDPSDGVVDVTRGSCKAPARLALGARHRSLVLDTARATTLAFPKRQSTSAPMSKLRPVTSTMVPPAMLPTKGAIASMRGEGTTSSCWDA